jgi:transketolase
MELFNNINPLSLTRLGQANSIFSVGAVLMKKNEKKLKLTTADYGQPSGMFKFKKEFPGDYYNVGIAEQNLIGISAGIVQEGYTTIAGAQACFVSMRSFEQVRQYMGYMQLPIILVGVSSGFSLTFFGNTHYALEDYGLMSSIPNITVLSPSDGLSALTALSYAVNLKKPVYIRTTGTPIQKKIYLSYEEINPEFNEISEGSDALLLSTGSITRNCIQAVNELKEIGYSINHIDVLKIHPIPELIIDKLLDYKKVFVVEEHFSINSFASKLRSRTLKDIKEINITNSFQKNIGDYDYLLEQNGLDSMSIKNTILANL